MELRFEYQYNWLPIPSSFCYTVPITRCLSNAACCMTSNHKNSVVCSNKCILLTLLGSAGNRQALLLLLAGLTHMSGGRPDFSWSGLLLSGAPEVTGFHSTCLSSFSLLARAWSPASFQGGRKQERSHGPVEARLGKCTQSFLLAKPSHMTKKLFYGRNCKIIWLRVWIQGRVKNWGL